MRLQHAIAFSKKLRWLTQTKVITLKKIKGDVNCVRFILFHFKNGGVHFRSKQSVFSSIGNQFIEGSFVSFRHPGVNFTNVLCAAFTLIDPKSVK